MHAQFCSGRTWRFLKILLGPARGSQVLFAVGYLQNRSHHDTAQAVWNAWVHMVCTPRAAAVHFQAVFPDVTCCAMDRPDATHPAGCVPFIAS